MTSQTAIDRRAPLADTSILESLRLLRELPGSMATVRERFGPVVRMETRLPGIPTIVWVSSPQGIHDVLSNRDGATDKRGAVHSEFRAGFGENSFSMPNEKWAPRRRTLQPAFTKKHVEAYAHHMAAQAARTVQRLSAHQAADLDEEMRHLTLDVLGRSMFGRDLGDRDAADLASAMPAALHYVTSRITTPLYLLPRWVPTLGRHRFRRNLARLRAVIDVSIDAFLADPDGSPAELIRELYAARDPETGRGLSREEIRDELMIFLIAGHDTTATTLTYALWQLGHHAEWQDRIADEVAALGHDEIQPSDLHSLPATTRVLSESMRLCPAAPSVSRMALRDIEVDGYRVEAGSEIVLCTYVAQRDPAGWEDPETFDPDRFLPERAEGRDRWQFLPFGGGPRQCIGSHFATLEATIGLATIVHAARITSIDPAFETAFPFTLTAAGEVPARVEPR